MSEFLVGDLSSVVSETTPSLPSNMPIESDTSTSSSVSASAEMQSLPKSDEPNTSVSHSSHHSNEVVYSEIVTSEVHTEQRQQQQQEDCTAVPLKRLKEEEEEEEEEEESKFSNSTILSRTSFSADDAAALPAGVKKVKCEEINQDESRHSSVSSFGNKVSNETKQEEKEEEEEEPLEEADIPIRDRIVRKLRQILFGTVVQQQHTTANGGDRTKKLTLRIGSKRISAVATSISPSKSETLYTQENFERPDGLQSHIEIHPHGGASVVHVYPSDMDHFSGLERRFFAEACLEEILSEDPKTELANHVIGIIHQGGAQLPNLLRLLSRNHPSTGIVREVFGQKNMTESTVINEYTESMDASFSHGTHRAGGLRPISLVGCFQEEKGGYFPEIIELLESNPFLRAAAPWGPLSIFRGKKPTDSDDGPIMWVRPGEQIVPLNELSSSTPEKTSRLIGPDGRKKRDPLVTLAIRPRVESPREKLVEDRTGCHADHAGFIPYRHPVAAVGLLQPVGQVLPQNNLGASQRAMLKSELMAKNETEELNKLQLTNLAYVEASIFGTSVTASESFLTNQRSNDLEKNPSSAESSYLKENNLRDKDHQILDSAAVNKVKNDTFHFVSVPVIDCKDVIAFHASDMQTVGDAIGLDFNEEPADQLIDPQFWIDDAKLNQLRRSGVRYSRFRLELNDVYFLPRKVVHQFKTVAASSSVTWHLRYSKYREFAENLEMGAFSQDSSNSSSGVDTSSSIFSRAGKRRGNKMSMLRSMR